MKKIVLLYILINNLFSVIIYAQKKIEPNDTDIAQAVKLKEKFDEKDNVAIIKSTENVTFNFNKKTEKVVVNHKIEEDLINLDERADIQKYYFYDGQSKILTFNILYKNKKRTGFRIEDEAFTSQGLFHNDSRVKYVNIDFPLKGYKYKSILKERITDIKYFTKLYFNDEYPIENKKITIVIPNWLNLELKEINFKGYDIKKQITTNPKQNSKTYTFTLEDIPAKSKEESAPGPTYIYPHLLILPKSYTNNTKENILFKETKDLYNWYQSLVKELKNENEPFKNTVLDLTKNAKTDVEKIKNIYYWVQDNIRYIAFEDGIAGFKPDEAVNVFQKKYGDCKGMANLTKQMLIEAGFDSRLVWIGTKRIAYDYSTPNLSVDNHMICAVIINGEITFLDATEKYNPFGEYAHRIQGKEALIENGNDFILKKVPELNYEFNKEIINYTLKLEGEELTGSATRNYGGERRTELLYTISNIKKDKKDKSLKKYLSRDNTNITVSNIKTSDLNNRESSLELNYSLTIKNAVSIFDKELYINLDFDKEFSSHNFKKRKLDYIFSSKKKIISTTVLSVPETYKILELPKNIALHTDNYDLEVTFTKNENRIIYKKKFKIKKAIIKKIDFESWNTFNNDLVKLYNEQITLIKK